MALISLDPAASGTVTTFDADDTGRWVFAAMPGQNARTGVPQWNARGESLAPF